MVWQNMLDLSRSRNKQRVLFLTQPNLRVLWNEAEASAIPRR
jgi:hypothetical protein